MIVTKLYYDNVANRYLLLQIKVDVNYLMDGSKEDIIAYLQKKRKPYKYSKFDLEKIYADIIRENKRFIEKVIGELWEQL